MSNQEVIINEIISRLTVTFGVGGFIIIVFIGWIIWLLINQKVNRIEQTFISELEKNRATELDLLYRRREVYSRLIKGMRVFLMKGKPDEKSTKEEKDEFLSAYDEAYIWAPDEVIVKLEEYIQANRDYSKAKKTASNRANTMNPKEELSFQRKLKEAHTQCLKKIRKDCGFKNTEVEYNFIGFVN